VSVFATVIFSFWIAEEGRFYAMRGPRAKPRAGQRRIIGAFGGGEPALAAVRKKNVCPRPQNANGQQVLAETESGLP
jgi:hypothetical protein